MEEVDVEPAITNIPAASHGKHLGFAWGPGDILVYETLYKGSAGRSEKTCRARTKNLSLSASVKTTDL
ncbi:unnamed protein product [Pleuronectes platessa]|uniref:Uncharacterized protein n=1 Tax=Pleuronectes platessa TaxID=8262 RepID=A0A9N7VIK0_PLEPL|nr:unnamed protein product [Pleuronectes platessa]